MKNLFKLSLLAVSVSVLAGCQQDAKKEEAKTAQAPKKEISLQTDREKQAYSVGASFGRFLTSNLSDNESVGIILDKEIIRQGFVDLLDGEGKLKEEDINETLKNLDVEIRKKKSEQARAESEKAIKIGEEFLAKFSTEDGVKKTDSGLAYKVINSTEGKKPVAADTVKVHYRGTLIDGTEFDSSYARGEPAEFPLTRVIKGWTEGVQLMPVGSKFKFVIPPELAYGDRPTGKIPANSTLIFDVELLEIKGGS